MKYLLVLLGIVLIFRAGMEATEIIEEIKREQDRENDTEQ